MAAAATQDRREEGLEDAPQQGGCRDAQRGFRDRRDGCGLRAFGGFWRRTRRSPTQFTSETLVLRGEAGSADPPSYLEVLLQGRVLARRHLLLVCSDHCWQTSW